MLILLSRMLITFLHNSNLIFLRLSLKCIHLDMVQLGISIYGLLPFKYAKRFLKLTTVLSYKTKIMFLKKVPACLCVNYRMTFVTNRASVIATIPVGYADGYNRCCLIKCDVLVRAENAVQLPEALQ